LEKCLENETKSPEMIENCSMLMYKKADLLRKRLSVKKYQSHRSEINPELFIRY